MSGADSTPDASTSSVDMVSQAHEPTPQSVLPSSLLNAKHLPSPYGGKSADFRLWKRSFRSALMLHETPNRPLLKWLEPIESVSLLTPIQQHTVKSILSLLLRNLTGKASAYILRRYTDRQVEQLQVSPYDIFEALEREAVGTNNQQAEELTTKLLTLADNVRDPTNFVRARSDYYHRLTTDYGRKLDQDLVRDIVLRSLPDDWRSHAVRNYRLSKYDPGNEPILTLDLLAETCERISRILPKPAPRPGRDTNTSFNAIPTDVPTKSCHNCGKKGHKSSDCKKPRTRCNKCNNMGHIAKFCRINMSLRCNSCGKLGHLQAKCRSRPQSHGTPRPPTYPAANAVPSSDDHTFLQPPTLSGMVTHVNPSIVQALASLSKSGYKDALIVDSGTVFHVVNNDQFFQQAEVYSGTMQVSCAGGMTYKPRAIGTAIIPVKCADGSLLRLSLFQALYVPEFQGTLISTNHLRCNKIFYNPRTPCLDLPEINQTIPLSTLSNGLDVLLPNVVHRDALTFLSRLLSTSPSTSSTDVAVPKQAQSLATFDYNLLHDRFGHPGDAVLQLLAKDMGHEIRNHDSSTCVSCVIAKSKQHSLPRTDASKHSTAPLQMVYSDLSGPTKVEDAVLEGEYLCAFVDEFSRYSWLTIQTSKKMTLDSFKSFVATLGKPRRLRTDNGGEYTSNAFEDYCREQAIDHQTTNARRPQQNAVVERLWQQLKSMARAILNRAGLSDKFWNYAILTANYLRNRLPHSSLPNKASPFEMFYQRKPSLKHIRTFGCLALPHVDKEMRPSPLATAPRAFRGVFLGYGRITGSYRVYNIDTHSVKEYKDVTFDESVMPMLGANNGATKTEEDVLLLGTVPKAIPAQPLEPSVTSQSSTTSGSFEQYSDSVFPNSDNSGSHSPVPGSPFSSHPSLPQSISPISDHHHHNDSHSIQSSPDTSFIPQDDAGVPDVDTSASTSASSDASGPVSDPSIPLDPPPVSTRAGRQLKPASVMNYGPKFEPRFVPSNSDINVVEALYRIHKHEHQPVALFAQPSTYHFQEATARDMFSDPSSLVPVNSVSVTDEPQTPKNFREAINSPEAVSWWTAMNDEWNSLFLNGTFIEVARSAIDPKTKLIPLTWAFRIKKDPTGAISRFRARCCAQGFRQHYGENFWDIYAPVSSTDSVLVLIAIAAHLRVKIRTADVKSAFLRTDLPLSEVVICTAPPGFKSVTPDGTEIVLRLNKCIYGLRQAPHHWHELISKFLLEFGFKRTDSDACLFIKSTDPDSYFALALHVDDMIVVCKQDQHWNDFLKFLESRDLSLTVNDPADQCLGLVFEYRSEGIFIHQRPLINETISAFNMDKAKPVSTPSAHDQYLSKSQIPKPGTPEHADMVALQPHMRRYAGKAGYPAQLSRPDLKFSLSRIASYLASPTKEAWKEVKRQLRYLVGTRDYGLLYKWGAPIDLVAYSDADFANCRDTAKSTTGVIILLSSTPVSWFSKKQSIVAQSIAESEYVAACRASRKVTYLRHLLTELGFQPKGPTPLRVDNQSAIKMSQATNLGPKTRHIAVRYHYVRDCIARKVIVPEYVPTAEQNADFLTKPMLPKDFIRNRDRLMFNSAQDSREAINAK